MNDNTDLDSTTLPPLPHRPARVSLASTPKPPAASVRFDTARPAHRPLAPRAERSHVSIDSAAPILARGSPALSRNPQ